MQLSTVRLFARRFQPAISPHGCITEARYHRLCFSTRSNRNRVQYDSWPTTGRLHYQTKKALFPASVPLLQPGQRECLLHLSTTRRGVSGVSRHAPLRSTDEETALVAEGDDKPGLLLVDGSMLLFRAHHRAAGRCHSGQMSEAEAHSDSLYSLLIALDLLLTYLKLQPSHFVLCFDSKGMTFRHDLFPEYKQGRAPTPYFIPVLKQNLLEALTHIPLPVLEVVGVEADDVIGTLTTRALASGMSVVIASSDKDFFQLLCPRVTLLRAHRAVRDESFGVEDFGRRFVGLQPEQYVDLLALQGDPSDNIKGVKGIGTKKACDLLRTYESLEKLLSNIDSIPSIRTRKLMEEGKESAKLSKKLAQLRNDLTHLMVPSGWDKYAFKPPKDGGKELQNYLEGLKEFGLRYEPIADQFEDLWKDMGEGDAMRAQS